MKIFMYSPAFLCGKVSPVCGFVKKMQKHGQPYMVKKYQKWTRMHTSFCLVCAQMCTNLYKIFVMAQSVCPDYKPWPYETVQVSPSH